MDQRPECKSWNIKLLEKNIGKNLLNINTSNFFPEHISLGKEIKTKMNKQDYVKLKSFCTAKDTISRTKTPYSMGEYIHKWHIRQGVNIQKYIKNSHTSIPKKQISQPGQGSWTDRHFSKEEIQMANRPMKRWSTSLIIREMPIKSTMRYHFTPVRMATIQKTNNKCWQGCGERGTLLHCWWECKLVQPCGKQNGSSSKNSKWKYHLTQEFPS